MMETCWDQKEASLIFRKRRTYHWRVAGVIIAVLMLASIRRQHNSYLSVGWGIKEHRKTNDRRAKSFSPDEASIMGHGRRTYGKRRTSRTSKELDHTIRFRGGFSLPRPLAKIPEDKRRKLRNIVLSVAILMGAVDKADALLRKIVDLPDIVWRRIRSSRIRGENESLQNPEIYFKDCWVYCVDPRDPTKTYHIAQVKDKKKSTWLCTHNTGRGDFEIPENGVQYGGPEMPLMAAIFNNDTHGVSWILKRNFQDNHPSPTSILGLPFPSFPAPIELLRVLKRLTVLNLRKSPTDRSRVQEGSSNGEASKAHGGTRESNKRDESAKTAPINRADPHKRTPLYVAARQGSAEIVKQLLSHGADPDIPQQTRGTPLFIASQFGNLECVQALLLHGANMYIPTLMGATALHIAAQTGRTEIAKTLLEAGMRPDCNGSDDAATPLLLAAQNGHVDVVRHLLEHGADPNTQAMVLGGATALFVAVKNSHADVVKELLARGADPTLATLDFNDTPLLLAIENGTLSLVDAIVKGGGDVNQPNINGITPLIIACIRNRTAIVQRLLNHNANPNCMTAANETALLWATHIRNTESARMLISKGANPNLESMTGNTPFLAAVSRDDAELVELYLDHGADLHYCHRSGLSPLDIARRTNSERVATLLLRRGARDNHVPAISTSFDRDCSVMASPTT